MPSPPQGNNTGDGQFDSVSTGKANITDAQIGPLSTGRVIIESTAPDSTNSEDLFAVDALESQQFIVNAGFVDVEGNPSHRVIICKKGANNTHIHTIDSYRENSFRNQLNEPTYNSTDDRWVFDCTGTNSASEGELIILIIGNVPEGGYTEL